MWIDNPTSESKKTEKVRKKEIRKVLSQAKTSLKQGKDLQNVEKSLNNLLADSANIHDEKMHIMLFQTLEMQYQQGNEKLFLKQKYDTASLFITARKMFHTLNRLDSVETMLGENKAVAPKNRKLYAQRLSPYYQNLYTGGIYFLNHQKYDEALRCIETYLNAPKWSLFSNEKISQDSSVTYHAAYIAFISNYRMSEHNCALQYKDAALNYLPRYEYSLQCLSDIYQKEQMKDSYLSVLSIGVDSFPKSTFFFPRLVDAYCEENEYEKALSLTEKVIASDTTNLLLHVTKQTLLLNLARYNECIKEGQEINNVNDSIPEVHYNIALAYYNQALIKDKELRNKPRERVRQVNALYRQCLPYMERFRKLAPNQRDRWRPVLYDIYLNLNMGKEFEKIEKE